MSHHRQNHRDRVARDLELDESPRQPSSTLNRRDAVALAAMQLEAARAPGTYKGWSGRFLVVMLKFGAPDGRVFWKPQTVMADELGWSLSTLRRCLRTARLLGLLTVFWSQAIRGDDGRWRQRRVNRYLPRWMAAYGALRAKRQVKPTVHASPPIPRSLPLRNEMLRRSDACVACGRTSSSCPLADVTYCERE